MAEIKKPVAYTSELHDVIAKKRADPAFDHRQWRDDDLMALRSYVRAHYRAAQLGKCAYCRQPVSLQAAANCHVEHIVPKSLYPEFIFEPKNLCVVCADCGEVKRDQETKREEPNTLSGGKRRKRYPTSAAAFLVVHPHFDDYDEHIEIVRGMYIDRSDKGHFTIGICRLNRKTRAYGWLAPFIDEEEVQDAARRLLDAPDRRARQAAIRRLSEALIQ